MTNNSMIPNNKLYVNYIVWGVVFTAVGILYGLNFRLGLYVNVFLALFAASIALKKFAFGASLALINMIASVITLLIYCAFATNQSCKSNPVILASFTPVMSFMLWLVLFGCLKFSKTFRSRYARHYHRDENDNKK